MQFLFCERCYTGEICSTDISILDIIERRTLYTDKGDKFYLL